MTVPTLAIEGALALLALGALAYGPWQWAMTDVARQAMFQSRDTLFDIGRKGEIDFASEEYQTIRAEINNLIRFAHRLTWTRLIFLARVATEATDRRIPIYQAIDKLDDPKLRAKIQVVVGNIESAAVRMIFLKSPVLVLLSILLIVPMGLIIATYLFSREFLESTIRAVGRLIQTEAAFLRS